MSPFGVLQCINLITQLSTKPEDVIGVISERNGFNFPLVRVNHLLSLPEESSFPMRLLHFYVFDNLNDTQITYYLEEMRFLSWFHPSVKFLFIGRNFSSKMLKFIADYYIINVTFLDISSGIITTTYPYKNNSLHTIDTEMRLIGSCNDNLLSMKADNLFPTKIPKQWKTTYIRTTHSPTPVFAGCFFCETRFKGIEIDIFLILIKHLGIFLNVTLARNKTLDMNHVCNYISDITFGLETVINWNRQMDITWPYLQEHVRGFIPPAPEIPRWKYISTIFHKSVWMALIVTILAISAAWIFVSYTNNEKTSPKLFFVMSLSAFVLFLGQSRKFTSQTFSHEILVLCIIFISTFTNFFFGTRLAYLLNGKYYELQIKNLKQVRENNFYIGYNAELVKIWLSQTLDMQDYPEHFYRDCDGKMLSCIQRATEKRGMVLIGSEMMIRNWAKMHSSNLSLETFDVDLRTVHICAFFAKGHPVFPLFNRMIQYLLESGIIKKISETYSEHLKINKEPLSARRLNFEHLVFPVFTWIIGILLSVVVFSYEKNQMK
ncbi:hypothetical protein HHI36_007089 [Cryptolaemus montrouzieri]|uniref:Uncharacterized protein n=1 Tax=Cryptolaemus montrouzieri TaxID=559131 RepID=A0ABD2MNK4_9CUCU